MEALVIYITSNCTTNDIKSMTHTCKDLRHLFLHVFEFHNYLWRQKMVMYKNDIYHTDGSYLYECSQNLHRYKTINWAYICTLCEVEPSYRRLAIILSGSDIEIINMYIRSLNRVNTERVFGVPYFLENAMSHEAKYYLALHQPKGVVKQILIQTTIKGDAVELHNLVKNYYTWIDLTFDHQCLMNIAVKRGHLSIVAMMLKYFTQFDPQYQRHRFRSSYIYIASLNNDWEMIRLLLTDERVRQKVWSIQHRHDLMHYSEFIDMYNAHMYGEYYYAENSIRNEYYK